MPRYLIVHPRDQRRDDLIIDDPDLTLRFDAGWAVLEDANGVCLAIPSGQGAHIERVNVQESAPQEE
ncbi:hypothetical protein [Streptomyces sp. NPDC008137]|uniref:hypothetical protein n=1 Tax=Streptomyces sp. NPDC008137 TaxID=3364813 RepID=UPI0036E78C12